MNKKTNELLEVYQQLNIGLKKQPNNNLKTINKIVLGLPLLGSVFIPVNTLNAQCQGGQASNLALPQNSTGVLIDVDGDGTYDFKIFDNNSAAKQATLNIVALNGGKVLTSGGSGTVKKYNLNDAVNGNAYNQYSSLWWLVFPQSSGGNWFQSYPNSGYIGVKQGGKYGFIQLTINSGPTVASKYDPYNISISEAGLATSNTASVQAADCLSLPISLTSFTVDIQGQTASLQWVTESEENNAGFELQRSIDGINFETLAFIEGNGTTVETQEYFYDDKELRHNQRYYYRLKQIDYSGQFAFSHIITTQVETEKAKISNISPNPTNGYSKLEYIANNHGELQVTVFNITGQALINKTVKLTSGVNQLEFDFSRLNKGNYFVKLQAGEDIQYQKLIIQ